MKKIVALVLALCMIGVTAAAQTTIELGIGSAVARVATDTITEAGFKTAPYITNGRTFVDLRDLADLMGIQFNTAEGSVTLEKDGKKLQFVLGENVAYTDGAQAVIDEGARLNGDVVMVPLRFVAENFGYDIQYVSTLNKIIVTDRPEVMTINGEKVSSEEFDLYYNIVGGGDMSGYSEDEAAYYKQMIINDVLTELAQLSVMNQEAGMLGLGSVIFNNDVADSIRIQTEGIVNTNPDFLESVVGAALEKVQLANTYFEIIVQTVTPSDDSVKKVFETSYITAKHILVTGEDALKTAQELKKRIDKGEDFDKLMNEYSEDGGLATYPDGYTFTAGEMVEEFYQAALALEENKVSDPVKSAYGYHIIKRLPLAEISQEELEMMKNNKAQENAFGYIEQLIRNSSIKINEDALNIYR